MMKIMGSAAGRLDFYGRYTRRTHSLHGSLIGIIVGDGVEGTTTAECGTLFHAVCRSHEGRRCQWLLYHIPDDDEAKFNY